MHRRLLFALCLFAVPALATPVTRQTFSAQPTPAPDATLSYGPSPAQGIDIYLPRTKGPHPVVLLIHGGCWMKGTAGREQLRVIGAELASRGAAVWSIGYRRVDEEGGAYPGIFQDVAKAIDLIPANAAKYQLDTSRVVAVGHSAGAHLAIWAASRGKLAPTSPAYVANHFPIRQVVALGWPSRAGTIVGPHTPATPVARAMSPRPPSATT
jgi:acetyl esterase/lipase